MTDKSFLPEQQFKALISSGKGQAQEAMGKVKKKMELNLLIV